MEVHEIVGALKYLEGKLGESPSTKEIADQAGVAEATAIKYLQRAVGEGLIIQTKKGRYITLEIARAFDAQKDKEVSKK